ncbi:hypothetical protein PF004_g26795 [Phytophthora fragariae]|uniref:Uncharacterized protein n=2 Tax=Phytophthora TaxID=4783 RepID=A0A6A3H414_9STRA|nr:hypothetical protein PR002_g29543 [Phytophthora rubi]KAE8963753.1 hypothetical protein PR001_g29275 [Phytophthora rubi]KAE9173990.1 hypothetical protein PF004_g26795 [Phytophthora fragariae]
MATTYVLTWTTGLSVSSSIPQCFTSCSIAFSVTSFYPSQTAQITSICTSTAQTLRCFLSSNAVSKTSKQNAHLTIGARYKYVTAVPDAKHFVYRYLNLEAYSEQSVSFMPQRQI